MNREDIIRMAREAKLLGEFDTEECIVQSGIEIWLFGERGMNELTQFAALVASAEREKYEAVITNMAKLLEAQQNREGVAVDMIAAGIAAEREACAKVCDEFLPLGNKCANSIRARGQA